MKYALILTILICAICNLVYSQQNDTNSIGASIQIYPAGIIPTFNLLLSIENNNYINLRVGGNFADRKDFSPYNDHEEGNGFGGTMGYRRNIYLKRGYLVLGPNLDIWNMWIHWENNIGEINYTFGKSYTLVIQPWAEFGYFIDIKKSSFQIGISTGFGREINVITNGKEVGQGWMNSALLNFQYVLK